MEFSNDIDNVTIVPQLQVTDDVREELISESSRYVTQVISEFAGMIDLPISLTHPSLPDVINHFEKKMDNWHGEMAWILRNPIPPTVEEFRLLDPPLGERYNHYNLQTMYEFFRELSSESKNLLPRIVNSSVTWVSAYDFWQQVKAKQDQGKLIATLMHRCTQFSKNEFSIQDRWITHIKFISDVKDQIKATSIAEVMQFLGSSLLNALFEHLMTDYPDAGAAIQEDYLALLSRKTLFNYDDIYAILENNPKAVRYGRVPTNEREVAQANQIQPPKNICITKPSYIMQIGKPATTSPNIGTIKPSTFNGSSYSRRYPNKSCNKVRHHHFQIR